MPIIRPWACLFWEQSKSNPHTAWPVIRIRAYTVGPKYVSLKIE